MKIIKFILKTLLVLVFICSVTVNILLFGSSYGTLVIKKDISLLKSMSLNFSNLMFEELTENTEKRGYKYTYKVEENDKTVEEYNYTVYFDEENNFNMTYTYNDGDNNETTFYITQDRTSYVLYTDTGNSKTKVNLTAEEVEEYKDDIISKIYDMSYLEYAKNFNFKEKDITTSLDISFSPFYFLGIKVKLADETKTDYVLHYDLNGSLRKVQTIEESKVTTMTFSFDDSEIEFPSFKPFSAVH